MVALYAAVVKLTTFAVKVPAAIFTSKLLDPSTLNVDKFPPLPCAPIKSATAGTAELTTPVLKDVAEKDPATFKEYVEVTMV